MKTARETETRIVAFAGLLGFVALGGAGCGGSPGAGSGAGNDAAPSGALAVSPPTAQVLTCETVALQATTGGQRAEVTWSVDGAGSMSADGVYQAPVQAPANPAVVVTATTKAAPKVSSSARLQVATVFPGAGKRLSTTALADYRIPHAAVASAGPRTYLAWSGEDASGLFAAWVRRSDDGGKSWQDAVKVNDNNGVPGLSCAAVAVDAADPDVLYLVYKLNGGGYMKPRRTSELNEDSSGSTLVFAVSVDGGKTFRNLVLSSNNGNAYGICPDVVSPSPGAVLVSAPAAGFGCPTKVSCQRQIDLWADGNRGAAFAQGIEINSGDEYLANGLTGALDDVGVGGVRFALIGEDISYEAPHLFSNGRGRACLSYLAGYGNAYHPYLQCSDDSGHGFGPPTPIADDDSASTPTGAVAVDGGVAVAWTSGGADGTRIMLRRSVTPALTFDSARTVSSYQPLYGTGGASLPTLRFDQRGILWLTYSQNVGAQGIYSLAVIDRSCDGGTTWSGPVAVMPPGDPEGSIMSAPIVERPARILVFGHSSNLTSKSGSDTALFMHPLE